MVDDQEALRLAVDAANAHIAEAARAWQVPVNQLRAALLPAHELPSDRVDRSAMPVPLSAPETAEETTAAVLYPVVDWLTVWAATGDRVHWLVEPIIERGRLYALFSPPKIGKSLLTLELAAALATGRPVLGSPARAPLVVLYVDLENSVADLVERLTALGYGPEELTDLRYLSFPNLPALDSPRGGRHLLAVAEYHAAELVVIDTVSRVVQGRENDSDTFHALYRHALAPLKAKGITVIRLDHSGKDDARDQRGSSAKSSDVDVVWKLIKTGSDTFALDKVTSRTCHGPDNVRLTRRLDPLRHEVTSEFGPDAAIIEVVNRLNALGVPTDAGRDRCRDALARASVRASNDTLTAAVRYRKSCPGQVGRK